MSKLSSLFNSFLKSPILLKLFFALLFVLFAIMIATISFAVHYNYENNYIKKDIHHKAISFIETKTNILKHQIDKNKQYLYSLKNNAILQSYIKTGENKATTVALFEQIISADKDIMQIRYIDESGMEIIRLERNEQNEKYRIVNETALQNKKDRYYFQETSKLNESSPIWLSDIDLNIENGKVIKPYIPTLRLAKPLFEKNKFKGIIIINIFMKDILNQLAQSDIFMISLMDKNGDFLIGKYELEGKLFDFAWSKYVLNKVNIDDFLTQYANQILKSLYYETEYLHSKKINQDLGLAQELILVAKIKEGKIEELRKNTIHKILDTLGIVLLISGPLGLLLAYIPALLSTKVLASSKKLDEKTIIFDEYLEAMNINNIISKSDPKGKITYVNKNFCDVTGYTKEEIIGEPHSILRDPDEPKETFKILWLTIQAKKVWKGILRNRKKDGGYYDVDIAIMPIINQENEIIEYLAIRHEITELMEQRKNLISIATKDPLCEVGNRYKLNFDLQKQIVNNLAVIDIDKFSEINDFYGHKLGDEIIIKFSKLLLENITDEFELYRLHSDKFAIHNYTLSSDRFTNFIVHLNTKMIESIIETDIKSFDIVTTAGVSSCDQDIILLTAEMVNKYAKKINKKVLSYSPELKIEQVFSNNIKWTEKVKKALHEGRIITHYQPIYNNTTNEIEKYETLVRLRDEDGTIISPFYFLDIAKSSGQYIDITKVVIQKSFEKFKDLDIEFSINLTVEDILDEELPLYLEEMLAQYNIAHKLVLELVESEGIEEFDTIQKFIKKMKNLGCKIAIDDFGTGYSNFEYLVKLQTDYIKIDGSMIKNINDDENMKEIVKTIIDFSKKMNYKTIAEFVFSEEVYKSVKELDIDYSQGYYIGAPQDSLL